MLIAKNKRKENIAEYVLYMWQIEDLLRALNFDGDSIFRTLVEPLNVSEDKKQEVFFWYMGIINILKEEKKEISGHNYHSLHIVRELNDVHLYLLKKDSRYNSLFLAAQGDIDLFREKSSKNSNDIEIAFDALYAKLLLKMKHEQISDETSAAFDRITSLIAYLSAKFHRFEHGEEEMKFDTDETS
ncbi:MAG: DUF4924 family protein [Prevotellaceae bacterium]|jgi:hypothetical protein|nr:DUF4924 family protein [Prevotellaceae bacterium]